jgi:hypothetical protein
MGCPANGRRHGARRRDQRGGGDPVPLVMGLDQHRAQIAAEWIDTVTGEVSRARIVPGDRAGVRAFLAPFRGTPVT